MNSSRIASLFEAYLDGSIGAADLDYLYNAAQELSVDEWASVISPFISATRTDRPYQASEWEPYIQNILSGEPGSKTGEGDRGGVPVVAGQRGYLDNRGEQNKSQGIFPLWKRVAAAAAVILIAGAAWLMFHNSSMKPGDGQAKNSVAADIAPGREGAVLTLADGKKVVLDSLVSGLIANQQGTEVILDGKTLTYNAGRKSEISYNTMTTPRGRQFHVQLPDGTHVWLNAASSITYPTAFTGGTREVSMTGEAYFEVKKNAAKPFIVKTGKDHIMVLGTHFNVNAYEDEPVVKTSLVEGSVKVGQHILKPGEAFAEGRVIRTNLAEDLAWKNGKFYFQAAKIEAIMRQISRWYDVDVAYEGKINRTFYGTISRAVSVSGVLKLLEETGGVHFKIEGRKVFVSP